MQFETIAILIFALALLVFMYTRRRVITDLQQQNRELSHQAAQLRDIAYRQREEISNLITVAEQERRARQMATLTGQEAPAKPRPPTTPPPEWKDPDLARDPFKNSRMARKQEEATRHDPAPASNWMDTTSAHTPPIAPSPAYANSYHGQGGTFDGGGASGDYGRSDSCSSSSSSSSSDSGSSSSSSSSDSGSSCSSD
jgi:hypothetical protein